MYSSKFILILLLIKIHTQTVSRLLYTQYWDSCKLYRDTNHVKSIAMPRCIDESDSSELYASGLHSHD